MNTKLLIIEDNEQDQKIIRRFLEKAGFNDIVIVDNGEDGLKAANEQNPDIVLVDTMLPGMDGFGVCQALKKDKKYPLKVIMMTGRIDAVDTDKAVNAGADDYCVKTSDCGPLLESIKKISSFATAEPSRKEKEDFPQAIKDQNLSDKELFQKNSMLIKTLYRELEKKNEELKELDKLKSQFVATVSHELRTPLTIIKEAVSQVVEGLAGDVNEDQKKKLNMAIRSANNLKRIINDLLDLAKLEAKKVELTLEKVDLVSLAADIKLSFEPLAKNKNIEIKTVSSNDSITVQADKDRIFQVLTNLVGNALKFTEKGAVTLAVSEEEQNAICAIEDTGCGIAEEDLPKVFGRFQQFGRQKKTKLEGTGLGLAICKDIIELHRGHMYVESKLGKGSKFSFTLPKRKNRAEGA